MMETTADKLRREIARAGISQHELSNISGIQQNCISLYCTGKREPSDANVKKLAKALKVSPDVIRGRASIPLTRKLDLHSPLMLLTNALDIPGAEVRIVKVDGESKIAVVLMDTQKDAPLWEYATKVFRAMKARGAGVLDNEMYQDAVLGLMRRYGEGAENG